MNKVDLYTAHYTDNNKTLKGTSFAAIQEIDGKREFIQSYDDEKSYMDMWMKGVADYLQRFNNDSMLTAIGDLDITIYMWHTNVQSMCKKLTSVVTSLRGFDCDLTSMIDRKLRKSNMSKYKTHDDQVRIVTILLKLDRKIDLTFKFKPLPPVNPMMQTAQQHAELIVQSHNPDVELNQDVSD
jgi:hypothetical protein